MPILELCQLQIIIQKNSTMQETEKFDPQLMDLILLGPAVRNKSRGSPPPAELSNQQEM